MPRSTRDTRADDSVKVRRTPRRRTANDGYRTRTRIRCGRRRPNQRRRGNLLEGLNHYHTHPRRASRETCRSDPRRASRETCRSDDCSETYRRRPSRTRCRRRRRGPRPSPDAGRTLHRSVRPGATRRPSLSAKINVYVEKSNIAETCRNSRGLTGASSPQLAPTKTRSLLATSPGSQCDFPDAFWGVAAAIPLRGARPTPRLILINFYVRRPRAALLDS